MKFSLQLQKALEQITPDWSWDCEILAAGQNPQPGAWPQTARVLATHKKSGRQTVPVLVHGSLQRTFSIAEAARFVCRILKPGEPTLVPDRPQKKAINPPVRPWVRAFAARCASAGLRVRSAVTDFFRVPPLAVSLDA